MKTVRRLLLAALALGALMPSQASAQSTFVFNAQAVSDSSPVGLGNSGIGAKAGTIGVPAFLEALAKDAATKNKCHLNFTGTLALDKADLSYSRKSARPEMWRATRCSQPARSPSIRPAEW
jgi:hypothetical protein